MMDANWALARKQAKLVERARIVRQIRAFFVQRDFLEVETPHRIPANAPEPHIEMVASGSQFLHTSPELAMKRLLAAGFPDLFQVARVWRDGERGSRHLPEFTLLEWYRTGTDYTGLMTDCEALFTTLVPEGRLSWQGHDIDLTPPWPRLTVADAFERFGSVPLVEALQAGKFDEIMVNEIEPHLGAHPVFLVEYPAVLGALARNKPGDPTVAERFELYVGGLELANAFSELTDSAEQRRRFEHDEFSRRKDGKPSRPMPEKFLAELDLTPECSGIALGLDRLVMLLTDSSSIDEVVAFAPEEL